MMELNSVKILVNKVFGTVLFRIDKKDFQDKLIHELHRLSGIETSDGIEKELVKSLLVQAFFLIFISIFLIGILVHI